MPWWPPAIAAASPDGPARPVGTGQRPPTLPRRGPAGRPHQSQPATARRTHRSTGDRSSTTTGRLDLVGYDVYKPMVDSLGEPTCRTCSGDQPRPVFLARFRSRAGISEPIHDGLVAAGFPVDLRNYGPSTSRGGSTTATKVTTTREVWSATPSAVRRTTGGGTTTYLRRSGTSPTTRNARLLPVGDLVLWPGCSPSLPEPSGGTVLLRGDPARSPPPGSTGCGPGSPVRWPTQGYHSFRFDYPGIGESQGALRPTRDDDALHRARS